MSSPPRCKAHPLFKEASLLIEEDGLPFFNILVDNPRIRLQKFLSEAGVCSRRAGERMILDGRVAVNGKCVLELGTKIDPEADTVSVDGTPLKTRRKLYVALHKPKDVVCTRKDPQGRATVLDFLPPEMHHVYPVGRLDYDSEGLLLLTSDGEFCNKITHPSLGIDKVYYVETKGAIQEEVIKRMLCGVHSDGDFLRASKVQVLSANNTRSRLKITLREGKNREVRRILDALDQIVLVLRRVQVGMVQIGNLPLGRWRLLTKTEVQSFLKE